MSWGKRPVLPLRPVSLQELRLQSEGLRWEVEQPIADLDSLTPVRGWVRAVLHGEALEVEGAAATIVTLCCDRCLQPFNHAVEAQVRELLELGGEGQLVLRLASFPSDPTRPSEDRPLAEETGTLVLPLVRATLVAAAVGLRAGDGRFASIAHCTGPSHGKL